MSPNRSTGGAQCASFPALAMNIYGYARVSTKDQTLASQDAQLREAGCAKVYSEKISGVRSDRPELAKVLKRLDSGDLLMVSHSR